ncbi:heavy metal translocating P-type ATPase [Mycobacterium sp. OTB74]|nr:heavy metal translocating P-type ATPase [Mycobacterium sp. OTB74]
MHLAARNLCPISQPLLPAEQPTKIATRRSEHLLFEYFLGYIHLVRQLLLRTMVIATIAALAAGGVAWLLHAPDVANISWIAGTLVGLVPSLWWLLVALRSGRLGVDAIAVLALIGTLAVGEYLAGALISVMVATGEALDAAAERRAARDLHALLDRAPSTARLHTESGVQTVPLAEVGVGDIVIVGPGEVVPVDGRVSSPSAVLDESALTGEPLHVERHAGEAVRSGVVNAGGAMEVRATATAENSTYAGIVKLAQEAAAETAPVVRIADRVATWFLPMTLAVSGAAWWLSGSPIRAVAVLVVATPCPLLLAAPVAIVSGLSRASRIGVVVRSGSALENLGHATTLVLDKTGTVTTGRPRGTDVMVAPGWDSGEVLRLAAATDQVSPHVLARAIVDEATERGLTLPMPTDVVEEAGKGVSGVVDGKRITVGNHALPDDLPPWAIAALTRASFDGAVIAWVSVDGDLTGAILLIDPVRTDAPRTIRRLRAAGIGRVLMLTGDRAAPAEQVGAVLGLDEVRANQSPADKVAAVRVEQEKAVTVMVGDGVNDAPALAAASVGIAMGAHGATASSEAADIVLTTDHLERVADAMVIARRSRSIALQSAVSGMGMSLVAMGFAAFGLLPAALGALLQEVIDIAVILNALRVLRGGEGSAALPAQTEEMLRQFADEHNEMRDDLALLRNAASLIVSGDDQSALATLQRADDFVQNTLLPHEQAEEHRLYPALENPLGSAEATATMSRMHAEIDRLAGRLHQHVELANAAAAITNDQREDLLDCLYGLSAVLRLHFATEEENFFTLG